MENEQSDLQTQLECMTISEIRSNHKVPSKFTVKKDIISYIINGPPPKKEDNHVKISLITPEIFEKVNGKIFYLKQYATMFCGFVQVVDHTKTMIKVRRLETKTKTDIYQGGGGTDHWIDKEWFDSHPYDKKKDGTINYYLIEQKKFDKWETDRFPFSLKLKEVNGWVQDLDKHYYQHFYD